MPLEQTLHGGAAALVREVGDLDHALVGTDPGFRQPVVIAEQAIDARRHVLGAGDRRDPSPAGVGQMLDGAPGAGAVVDVDVADPVGRWPATDDDRDAGPAQAGGQRVGSVEGDEHGAVGVAGAEVSLDAILIGSRVRHQEDRAASTPRPAHR